MADKRILYFDARQVTACLWKGGKLEAEARFARDDEDALASFSGYIAGAAGSLFYVLADVVEDSEVRTGRRSEGMFFAGGFFVQKCTSGIGIFVCGLILAAAGFPAKAVPGQVPVATLDRLTLIYAGAILFFYALAAFF